MIILVINCGSSSIKYQLYRMPGDEAVAKGMIGRIGQQKSVLDYEHNGRSVRRPCHATDHNRGMGLILGVLTDREDGVIARVDEIGAVGHRVVHGKEEFTGSVLITDEVVAAIERCAELAPLHNPANLTGIRAAQRALPGVPQVACFDTAFHQTIPEVAYMYALPRELYERHGIRRYGFHGTSHRWVARRAAEMLGIDKYDINCVTCHLGNGCSATAVKGGRSVDTSMGLTPLEGLVMGTRTGDIDPAIIFHLADKGHDLAEINETCNRRSGLLGLSGVSNDMREIISRAEEGDERAALAIDVFAYRLRKYIGAYTAVAGPLHAVVFTGGIGENAAPVREAVCSGLSHLGIEVDAERNRATVGAPGDVSRDGTPVRLLVIPTDEERAIALDTYEIAARKETGA
jgi:acetate kinase